MERQEFLEGKSFTCKGLSEVFKYENRLILKLADGKYRYYCSVPCYYEEYFEAWHVLFGKPNLAIVMYKDLTLFSGSDIKTK